MNEFLFKLLDKCIEVFPYLNCGGCPIYCETVSNELAKRNIKHHFKIYYPSYYSKEFDEMNRLDSMRPTFRKLFDNYITFGHIAIVINGIEFNNSNCLDRPQYNIPSSFNHIIKHNLSQTYTNMILWNKLFNAEQNSENLKMLIKKEFKKYDRQNRIQKTR